MKQFTILVAGIGNIFLGDDAFGVEVVKQLARRSLPAKVEIADFGTRSADVISPLLDKYHTVILVNAIVQGERPGTLSLIEGNVEELEQLSRFTANQQSMNSGVGLQLVQSVENHPKRLYLVGCEPGILICEEGWIGLSESSQRALPQAILMIETLLAELLRDQQGALFLPGNLATAQSLSSSPLCVPASSMELSRDTSKQSNWP